MVFILEDINLKDRAVCELLIMLCKYMSKDVIMFYYNDSIV